MVRAGRYASPFTNHEIANATIATYAGKKIGAFVTNELPVQSTLPIMMSPHSRQTVSRLRFSAGRSRRLGTLDFRNSHIEKRMKETKSRTADT